jgi:hypothetical protein
VKRCFASISVDINPTEGFIASKKDGHLFLDRLSDVSDKQTSEMELRRAEGMCWCCTRETVNLTDVGFAAQNDQLPATRCRFSRRAAGCCVVYKDQMSLGIFSHKMQNGNFDHTRGAQSFRNLRPPCTQDHKDQMI